MRITGVDLVPDQGASDLDFKGVWVTRNGTVAGITRARYHAGYAPAAGYCLPPAGDGDGPLLVLRIGPSRHPGAAAVGRNNAVNVHYTTADGDRYVAAYAVRFEYPNTK
ncbi:hypothetical protein [Nocardioides sp.]|uniref:hypothetical protein n=1 Tax=Nocardioides sp. TaxID=35761 RepID=UPI002ED8AFCB